MRNKYRRKKPNCIEIRFNEINVENKKIKSSLVEVSEWLVFLEMEKKSNWESVKCKHHQNSQENNIYLDTFFEIEERIKLQADCVNSKKCLH